MQRMTPISTERGLMTIHAPDKPGGGGQAWPPPRLGRSARRADQLSRGAILALVLGCQVAWADDAVATLPVEAAPAPTVRPIGDQTQSSANVETIVVNGTHAYEAKGAGLVVGLSAPKAASTITQQFIRDQAPGANPFDVLILTPGIAANGRGATGLDRTQISVRGFQSNQVGLSIDGIPLNDSGTFTAFPQEYVDSENLQQIYLMQGSGDVDTPNIGETGGSISMIVQRPANKTHLSLQQSAGANSFRRSFLRVDTGTFAHHSRAFLSYSDSAANQWRGIGHAERKNLGAMVVHKFGADSEISMEAFYNVAKTAQYEALTMSQIGQYGYNFDYAPSFAALAPPQTGTTQNANNSAAPGSQALLQRANFGALAYNPFKNLILAFKADVRLAANIYFSFQPYLWYSAGNGGGSSYVPESNVALLGAPRDLNGDGDTLDTQLFYNPYTQQQRRPGFIARVKWNVANQEIVAGFHYEHATLHEWRPYIAINPTSGVPVDYWASAAAEVLVRPDGSFVRDQDQVTTTLTMRPFLEDTLHFEDDQVRAKLGVQFPYVDRTGDNRLPAALRTANGVTAPLNPVLNEHAVMPSAGFVDDLSPAHQLFASVAKTFRASDNLPMYQPGAPLSAVQPETAIDAEAGYRYTGDHISASATLYNINYANREQSLFDVTVNNYVSKNIGSVLIHGIELELGLSPVRGVSAYASASLNAGHMKDNVRILGNTSVAAFVLPTQGKELTDLPRLTASGLLRYDAPGRRYFALAEARFTSRRYATLVNDEYVGGYTVLNLAAGYKFARASRHGCAASLLLSVDNATNRKYLGAINFGNNTRVTGSAPSNPATYYAGAPTFVSVKLRVEY